MSLDQKWCADLAKRVLLRVNPDADPAMSLELPVLTKAFCNVDDEAAIIAAVKEFFRAGHFPKDGPFSPLYLLLGYKETPDGYVFAPPRDRYDRSVVHPKEWLEFRALCSKARRAYPQIMKLIGECGGDESYIEGSSLEVIAKARSRVQGILDSTSR